MSSRSIFSRKLLPRTLFARSLLIILTPVLLMQAIAIYMFFDRHWGAVVNRLNDAVAGDIAWLSEELRQEGTDMLALNHTLRSTAELSFELIPLNRPLPQLEHDDSPTTSQRLVTAIQQKIGQLALVSTNQQTQQVMVMLRWENQTLVVYVPLRRLYTASGYTFLAWMLGSALVLLVVSLFFMRGQIRPIRRLGIAAELFGKGQDVPHFKPEGATEVRQAAQAFLIMRERIRRQISQRTEMLAGVSHDLRTPLTRMKLQLALLGDFDGKQELTTDITEMEKMIAAYLDFARGEGMEASEDTDLVALLDDIVENQRRHGQQLSWHAPTETLHLKTRPISLRRALANLLGNAAKYASHAELSLCRDGKYAVIRLDDNGPGIPPDRRDEVFRPFTRIDDSRNQDTGGVGLGLAIARDIIQRHGGDIRLGNSRLGGLLVDVILPL